MANHEVCLPSLGGLSVSVPVVCLSHTQPICYFNSGESWAGALAAPHLLHPNPSLRSQLTVKPEAVRQSQTPGGAPAADAVASSCSPSLGTWLRAAAMAPRHEAPRLARLSQIPDGTQKPIELPAAVAAAAAGAAAAQADDAQRGGAGVAGG